MKLLNGLAHVRQSLANGKRAMGWKTAMSLGLATLLGQSSVVAQSGGVPGKPATKHTLQTAVQPANFQSGSGTRVAPTPDPAFAQPQFQSPIQAAPLSGGPLSGGPLPGAPFHGAQYPGAQFPGAPVPPSNFGPTGLGIDACDVQAGMHFNSSMFDGGDDHDRVGLGGLGSRLSRRLSFRKGHGPFSGVCGDQSCQDFAGIDGARMECSKCGYSGCPSCGWGLALLAKNKLNAFRSVLSPYKEAGLASQRWFDIQAGAIVFRREDGPANFVFSTDGISGTPVLGSDQVDFDQFQAGLQVLLNLQTGPGSNLEFGYFGLNRWEEEATVTSPTPTLFSFISNFGVAPPNGFDDPDRSFQHTINYQSELHNGEINFRRRWVGPYQWFQGSWLAGVRYFDLDEQLTFTATGENNDTLMSNGQRFFEQVTQVRNQLTGFQIGSDLWMNLRPGIRTGVEWKTGVFGNHADTSTVITANSLPNSISEGIDDGRTAFLGQLSVQSVYRFSYALSVRASYELLYVDNVALAPENINSTPPAIFLPSAARTPFINTDGEILYTGYSIGGEFRW